MPKPDTSPLQLPFRLSNGIVIDPLRLDHAVIDLLERRASGLTERTEKDSAIMDLRDVARHFADTAQERKS